MKIKDLRALSSDELIQKEKVFKKELFDLNFQRKSGRVDKPGRFEVVKRSIARILTILQERETEQKENNGNRDKKK